MNRRDVWGGCYVLLEHPEHDALEWLGHYIVLHGVRLSVH
jgi:hypothetical protein